MTEDKKVTKTAETQSPTTVETKAPAKKAPAKKAAPAPELVWFESREKEPTMFPVAGINPIRNFTNGRLEYRVKPDDVARFEQNHFVQMGRVVRKAS